MTYILAAALVITYSLMMGAALGAVISGFINARLGMMVIGLAVLIAGLAALLYATGH